jgi:hypothetical protein
VSVTCNGAPATIAEPAFSCNVTVPAGTSAIPVRTADTAGNVRTVVVTVSTLNATAPTSLRITPQQVTMIAGETHRFSVMDNLGRIPSNAAWTVDHSNVATVATTPEVVLTAVSAGEVTLTASWQGLTATTHVTVLGLDVEIPAGTIFWAAPSGSGEVTQIVPGAIAPDGARVNYVLTRANVQNPGSVSDTIRAVADDGRELWTATPGYVTQLSGDPLGGVVAQVFTAEQYGWHKDLVAFSANGAASQLGPIVSAGFAIHPNGVVYAVQGHQLVGLDIGLGGAAPI